MKPSILIIIGSILLVAALVVGGIGTIASFLPLTHDPSEEAIYTIKTPRNISLEKGEYEIWIKNEGYDWKYVEIKVFNSQGDVLELEKSEGDVNLKGEEYLLYGKLSIPEGGEYRFTSTKDLNIYITEPLEIEKGFGIFCMACSLTSLGFFIGFLMILIGITLIFVSGTRSKEKKGRSRKRMKPEELDWKWLFFSFEGRIGRKEFILGSLIHFGAMMVYWMLAIIILILLGVVSSRSEIAGFLWLQIYLSLILFSLVFLWPQTALVVKRLRDLDLEPLLAIPYILLRGINLIFWILLAFIKGRGTKKAKKKAKGKVRPEKIEEPYGEGLIWVLFRFKGRLERRRYIFGSILIISLTLINWVGGFFLMKILDLWFIFLLIFVILILFQILLTWPNVALGVKRLRDMGYEPLLVLLLVLLPWVPIIGGIFGLIMRIWMMIKKGKPSTTKLKVHGIPINESMRLILIGIFIGVFSLLMTLSGIGILIEDLGEWPYAGIFILIGTLSSLGLIQYIRKTINNLRLGFPRQDEYSKILIRKSATRAFFIFMILQILLMLFIDLIGNIHLSELILVQVLLMLVIFGLCYLWSYYMDDSEGGG